MQLHKKLNKNLIKIQQKSNEKRAKAVGQFQRYRWACGFLLDFYSIFFGFFAGFLFNFFWLMAGSFVQFFRFPVYCGGWLLREGMLNVVWKEGAASGGLCLWGLFRRFRPFVSSPVSVGEVLKFPGLV